MSVVLQCLSCGGYFYGANLNEAKIARRRHIVHDHTIVEQAECYGHTPLENFLGCN